MCIVSCQCRRHKRCVFDPWVGKIPWKRKWQPTPIFLPEKSHGQRSLVGYSPKGSNELHTTEHKCLEKCIVSLLTMLSISSISAEPSTERTTHKYLILLTFKIKILNNNQIHGWEFSLGKSKRRQEGKRNMPKRCFFFFFQLGVTNSEAHPGGYYHLVKDACTHRYYFHFQSGVS